MLIVKDELNNLEQGNETMKAKKEHYDLMSQFERNNNGRRLDREDKKFWQGGHVYQDGQTNDLYQAFFDGYMFYRSLHIVNAVS